MNKIQNIQALRGIAVMSVVFVHLLTVEHKYGGSRTVLPDILLLGSFGVDLFFVISGFVMVAVTRGTFQIPRQASKFIYRRVSRIYPTYWVYSLLVLIVFILQPSWVNNSQGNQVDILNSFLLFPSHTLPLVMVGWTLIHEMYFYLAFCLIFLLICEKHLPYTLLAWGLGVALLNYFLESSNPTVKIISHPLTMEFISGCFLAIIYYKNDVKINTSILLILLALSVFAALHKYLPAQNITLFLEQLGWWRPVVFGLPAFLVVYCVTNAEKNGHLMHSSLIQVGNASYSIYLSHVLTLSAIGRIWSKFSSDKVFDNIIMIPILLILVLVVGFMSYQVVEKPLLHLTRQLPGTVHSYLRNRT